MSASTNGAEQAVRRRRVLRMHGSRVRTLLCIRIQFKRCQFFRQGYNAQTFPQTFPMSRLLCLILLSLGLVQSAMAEENGDRVSAYLTQKFGLAKEKAEKISDAV